MEVVGAPGHYMDHPSRPSAEYGSEGEIGTKFEIEKSKHKKFFSLVFGRVFMNAQ